MSTDHKNNKPETIKTIHNYSAAKRLLVKGLVMKLKKEERNRFWLTFSDPTSGEVMANFNSVSKACLNKLKEIQMEKNGNPSEVTICKENKDDLINTWQIQRESLYEKALAKFHAGEGKVPSQDYFVGLNNGIGKHLYCHISRANVEKAYFSGLTLNTKGNPIPKLLIPLTMKLEDVEVDGRVGGWPVRAAFVVKEEKEKE